MQRTSVVDIRLGVAKLNGHGLDTCVAEKTKDVANVSWIEDLVLESAA